MFTCSPVHTRCSRTQTNRVESFDLWLILFNFLNKFLTIFLSLWMILIDKWSFSIDDWIKANYNIWTSKFVKFSEFQIDISDIHPLPTREHYYGENRHVTLSLKFELLFDLKLKDASLQRFLIMTNGKNVISTEKLLVFKKRQSCLEN